MHWSRHSNGLKAARARGPTHLALVLAAAYFNIYAFASFVSFGRSNQTSVKLKVLKRVILAVTVLRRVAHLALKRHSGCGTVTVVDSPLSHDLTPLRLLIPNQPE
jgi:hypothetical protein